eukprot:TRINITY_DN22386_c0_g1_i4.p1 TRINITY_DN22386_c0_g1~~TRINITY_DN22386_c0_g1_i4.p1  ORF type:complete len:142 (+),score=21.79 TRINITY_DN22386_c0_g1_i4:124-549(+)
MCIRDSFLYSEIESVSNNATLIPFDAALAVEDKLSPPLVLWYTLVSETGQLISSTISPMIAYSKTTKKAVLRQWVKMKDKLSQTSTATNPVMIATLDDLSYLVVRQLSLIHISEPTRLLSISYAVFCLKKKTKPNTSTSLK